MAAPKGYVKIGTVGVDAGMVYMGDPCYFIEKPLGRGSWENFLDSREPPNEDASHWTIVSKFAEGSPHTFPAGVLVTSGEGDGEYPVYALIREGRVRKIVIDFGG